MKKISRFQIPLAGILCALVVTIGVSQLTFAAQKKEARVTQVIKDVRVLGAGAAPRPASLNDLVRDSAVVRTGVDSRTELTFSDQSLTRLGANSVFSFSGGGKEFDLNSGAILVAVPPSGGEVKIKTAAATAAITGFTAMYEYHPKGVSKFIVLEGEAKFKIKGVSGACDLTGGHMIVIPPNAKTCPKILTVELDKLMKSAKLITKFRPLPKWALEAIFRIIEEQKNSPPPGGFADPTNIDTLDQAGNAIPTPPPTRTIHSE
jgi:hypothetical protein